MAVPIFAFPGSPGVFLYQVFLQSVRKTLWQLFRENNVFHAANDTWSVQSKGDGDLWHPDISWYPFHVRILARLPRKQRSKSPLGCPSFFSSSSTSFPSHPFCPFLHLSYLLTSLTFSSGPTRDASWPDGLCSINFSYLLPYLTLYFMIIYFLVFSSPQSVRSSPESSLLQ